MHRICYLGTYAGKLGIMLAMLLQECTCVLTRTVCLYQHVPSVRASTVHNLLRVLAGKTCNGKYRIVGLAEK